jgi:hypothetical protein
MSQENVEVVLRGLKSRRDRGIIAHEQGDERRVLMKLRVSLAVVACVVGASLIPGTAAADRPTKETFDAAVLDDIVCDETVVLTVQEGGMIASRSHVHELPSGDRFRHILAAAPRHVEVTDGETVYRMVGPGIRGNFTSSSPDPDVETGDEVGFFRIRLNIIGPDGLFGKVNLRFQFKRNGDVVERDKGNCEFV